MPIYVLYDTRRSLKAIRYIGDTVVNTVDAKATCIFIGD